MSTPAPTDGWDLVYAVRLPQVNARIASQNTSPKAFSEPSGEATVSGSFGTWQIVPGGSGYLVFLQFPLTGTLTQPGKATLAFSGTAKVSVELNYLSVGASSQALQIQQSEGVNSSSIFSIKELDLGSDVEVIQRIFIQAALQSWLIRNTGVFNQVFAVVDLSVVAAEAAYSWLRPTSLSYAYCDAPQESDCLLAILAMTQQRSSAGLAQQVDAGVVAAGSDAALLISPWVLLHDIILNALPVTFPGTATGDFSISKETPSLTLNSGCQLSSITYQGTSYQPLLESFSIAFQGNQIVCSSLTSIPVFDGVTAYTSVNSTQGMTIGQNSAGQQTLLFTEIGTPQVRHWTQTDPSIDQTDEEVAIAIGVCATVVSISTGGALGIAIVMTGALVSGIVANLPEFIADWTSDTAPSLDLMAANVSSPFVWTGGTTFAVTGADLSESVRLSGTPWPPTATGAHPA